MLGFLGRLVVCIFFLNKGFILLLLWYVLLSVPFWELLYPLCPEETWLALPLNTKQNTFAEHAASSAAFTSLTFTAAPTPPWLSRARAQTVTALGSFTRAPLELVPSPRLPGIATSQLHPISSHTGRRQRCENAGDQGLGLQGNPARHPQECQIPATKQQFGKGLLAAVWCSPANEALLVSPQHITSTSSLRVRVPDCKSIFNLCAPHAVIHLQLHMKNPQRTCQLFLDVPQHSAGRCLGVNWLRFAVGWTLKRWETFGKKQCVLPQLLLQGTTITEATRQNNHLHTLSYFCVKPHLICCSILHALYLIHF